MSYEAKRWALLQMYCPEEIVNELLTLRENNRTDFRFSNYVVDDSINYMYPTICIPMPIGDANTEEWKNQYEMNKLQIMFDQEQKFRRELQRLKNQFKTNADKNYTEGTKLMCDGYKGVVVKNYKLPGDICVEWETGVKSSYDKYWLNENTIIID